MVNMQILKYEAPFFIHTVDNHELIKPLILQDIKSLGVNRLEDSNERISNTDWHIGSKVFRNYFRHVEFEFYNVLGAVAKELDYPDGLGIKNYWFQQYNKNDEHKWHVHPESMFSSVYYVDLPDDASRTTFRIFGEEFEVSVKEGQILSFPSCFLHCSKPSQSDKVKTIIAFNSR